MIKLHRDNFDAWLSGRIRAASQGTILDFETGEYVEVATAPSRIFLEHTKRRAELYKSQHKAGSHSRAIDQAKADPNDPFTYARTKTHLEGGLCELEDYSVEFKRITVDMLDLITGEVIGRKMADVPMRIRRA